MADKMRTGFILKNPIAFVLVIVSICSLSIIFISMQTLPEMTHYLRTKQKPTRRASSNNEEEEQGLGKFAEMMIDMLPNDLPFTLFIPSDKALQKDLRLPLNDSFSKEKMNDTYAIVSRILGFSAVPRSLSSTLLDFGKEVSYDSLSGFTLYVSKDIDGRIFVNGIVSERVDLKKRDLVLHIMNGVIMDAEFEQSVQPDYDED